MQHGAYPPPQQGAYPPPQQGSAVPANAALTNAPANVKNYGVVLPQPSERFAPSNGFRDPFFAILFILVVLAILGLGFAQLPSVGRMEFDGTLVGIAAPCGVILPFLYLLLLRQFAKTIIWIAAIASIILQFAAAVFFYMWGAKHANYGSNPMLSVTIAFAVTGLISMLWLYCVKSRIPFASDMLSLSTSIIKQFTGNILYMYIAIFMVGEDGVRMQSFTCV